MSELLEGIRADELLQRVPANVRSSLEALERAGADWNAVGVLLAATPTAGVALKGTGQWTANLWDAVKTEFRSFLCTESGPYAELRREWDDLKEKSAAQAAASLSEAIGAKLGVASGVLAPLVTWLFIVALRMGKEAACVMLSTAPNNDSAQPWSPHA
jgi:hypothetical protein